jgi:ribosomal protein L37AE/L43A
VKGQKVACWAAQWLDEDEIMHDSSYKSSEKHMLRGIHKLLDEADVVVHQNGERFDVPMLNTEFLKHGMKPPAPFKQVDLKKISQQKFRFPTSKLEYVAKAVGAGEKMKEHVNFELWTKCMEGDPVAWDLMEKYNKQDVRITTRVYKIYLPWISKHPNAGSYRDGDKEVCPNCGSKHYHRRGFAVAHLKRYPRFQCQDCGAWFRSNVADPNKKVIRNVSI